METRWSASRAATSGPDRSSTTIRSGWSTETHDVRIRRIAKNCLQISLCSLACPRGHQLDHPHAPAAAGADPPDPAADARHPAHRGPTTATALAPRLGLNTGATSYHLRQLAQHGFIVDDDVAGQRPRALVAGRARSTRTDVGADDPDAARRRWTPTCSRSSWSTPRCCSRPSRSVPLLPHEWRNASTFATGAAGSTREQAKRADRGARAVIEEFEAAEERPDDRPE